MIFPFWYFFSLLNKRTANYVFYIITHCIQILRSFLRQVSLKECAVINCGKVTMEKHFILNSLTNNFSSKNVDKSIIN